MTKFVTFFLSLGLVLGLAACGRNSSQNDTVQPPITESVNTAPENTSEISEDDNGQSGSVVYFTTDISPEGMMAVYEALG